MLLLSGCSLAPSYQRPDMNTPASWSGEHENTPTDIAYNWWKSFGDEELDGFMKEALAHNNELLAGLQRIEQARAGLKIAGASRLPAADASADASWSSADRSRGSRNNNSSLNAGVSVSYELDLFGMNRNSIKSAEADLQASSYDQQALALIVMGDVATDYFTLLNLRERLKIADNNLDNSREVLRITEARVREGAISELELAQQKVVVATSEAARASLVQQIRNAENALAVLLGEAPESIVVDGQSLDVMTIPYIAAGQPSALLERRPDVRSAEAGLKAANADIGVARAAFFPSVSLGVGETISTTGFGNPLANVFSIASSLLTPIFQGGRLEGGVERATARQQELVEDYRRTVLVAFQEVEDALAAVKATRVREDVLETAMQQARKAYRLSKIRYDQGAIDFQTLIDTQNTQLSAEDSYSQARLARLTAAIDLYKALGGGWVSQ